MGHTFYRVFRMLPQPPKPGILPITTQNTIIDHRIYPASKTMLLAHVTEFPRMLLQVQRYTLLELGLNIMDGYDYQINSVN